MKIQIDTTAKTIKVGQNVKFSELIPALDALFPNDGWKEYELQPEIITNIVNPIAVRPWWDYNPPYSPYTGRIVYCGATAGAGLHVSSGSGAYINSATTATNSAFPSTITLTGNNAVTGIPGPMAAIKFTDGTAQGVYTLDINEN